MSLGKIIKIIHFDFLYNTYFWSCTIRFHHDYRTQYVCNDIHPPYALSCDLWAFDLLCSLCSWLYSTGRHAAKFQVQDCCLSQVLSWGKRGFGIRVQQMLDQTSAGILVHVCVLS